ncbi:MAG: alpha-galactosidase [Candidatus Sumerlaeaceae bacterium]
MQRHVGLRKTAGILLTIMSASVACAVLPRAGEEEKAAAREWIGAAFGLQTGGLRRDGADQGSTSSRESKLPAKKLPASFTYAGQPFARLAPSWLSSSISRALDSSRTQHTITWRDPASGLEVSCVALEYVDYPVVEWTTWLRNRGTTDTAIIADLAAIDSVFEPAETGAEFTLHHNTGSPCLVSDYQPFSTPLSPGGHKRITTSGGRPSNSDLPYFNLEKPGGGIIMAIGWPGQWSAAFIRDSAGGLRITAGQELTRFRLRPGEEARTPLIALQFWSGSRVRAQNLWRRWMLEHNLPRPFGKAVSPQMAACSSHQFGEMIHANEENQKLFIDRYMEEGLKLDFWWMDAGWYVNNGQWSNTGTWEVDRQRFPRGLRAITDYGRKRGVRSIVWFEPERVTPGTWLDKKHPEWLLGRDGDTKLLNLGNPEALRWVVEHTDSLIKSEGIDLYRNDYNIDPLTHWRANDTEDRQGMTEMKYVISFLKWWDELRRRHPDMLIDTCASGGRRNDLETLRRSVPLLRSDYILEPVGQQCHTYGLASWIPFYGTGMNQFDTYSYHSTMCPNMIACYDVRRRDLDYDALRRLDAQWRTVAPSLLGDFYPLTPYSLDHQSWMAWQFDRPEAGEGIVQAFRRSESSCESAQFKLSGLFPHGRYVVTDLNTSETRIALGQDLLERGLLVKLAEQPASALFTYRITSNQAL